MQADAHAAEPGEAGHAATHEADNAYLTVSGLPREAPVTFSRQGPETPCVQALCDLHDRLTPGGAYLTPEILSEVA